MLIADGASAERRQTNLPIDCSPLVLEVNVTTTTCPNLIEFPIEIDLITNPFSPQWNTDLNRDWLQGTLDDFCTTDCLNYTVRYYSQDCDWAIIVDPNDLINLYQNYFCGSNNGKYCLVEMMEYLEDTAALLDGLLHCTNDETCSPDCKEALEDVQNELGCCAVNLFNTTTGSQGVYALYEAFFEDCELSLNPAEMCSGALQIATASLNLLLFVAVSLSTFFLS